MSTQVECDYVLELRMYGFLRTLNITVDNEIKDGEYYNTCGPHDSGMLAWKDEEALYRTMKTYAHRDAVWNINCNLDSYYLLKYKIECTLPE
jgi:hypothetical protein